VLDCAGFVEPDSCGSSVEFTFQVLESEENFVLVGSLFPLFHYNSCLYGLYIQR
jgi:hypothetical protein